MRGSGVVDEELIPAERLAEAGVWIARLHSGARDPSVTEGLREWLAARPVNARAFELATEVWAEAENLRRVVPLVPDRSVERSRRLTLRIVSLAAASLAAIAATVALFISPGSSFSTDVGEQRTVTLTDGTRVFLNTASRLVVRYDKAARRVELKRGEALFEVAKRKDWPFIVAAGDRQIRALGTSFVVRRDGDHLTVTLMEGRVTVSPLLSDERSGSPSGSTLIPGQRLTFAAGRAAHLDSPPLEKVVAWRRGQVILDDTPLAAAAAEMNRYSSVKLLIERPEAETLPVSGLFQAGDSTSFANAVAQTYGLTVVTRQAQIVVSGIPTSRGAITWGGTTPE